MLCEGKAVRCSYVLSLEEAVYTRVPNPCTVWPTAQREGFIALDRSKYLWKLNIWLDWTVMRQPLVCENQVKVQSNNEIVHCKVI